MTGLRERVLTQSFAPFSIHFRTVAFSSAVKGEYPSSDGGILSLSFRSRERTNPDSSGFPGRTNSSGEFNRKSLSNGTLFPEPPGLWQSLHEAWKMRLLMEAKVGRRGSGVGTGLPFCACSGAPRTIQFHKIANSSWERKPRLGMLFLVNTESLIN